jgi:hypothetical protein
MQIPGTPDPCKPSPGSSFDQLCSPLVLLSHIQILGPNYMEGLTKWIDIENIPVFLGGERGGHATPCLSPRTP